VTIIRVFDFFFRGFIILGTFILIVNNFKKIKKNRFINDNKETIKYYNSLWQKIFPYFTYLSSVLIGLSLFRIGSLLQVYDTGLIQLKFWGYVILDNADIERFKIPIIIIGCIGAISYLFFCIVQNLSFVALGEHFSTNIDIKEEHKLITKDIYGVIRHPIYLSEFMLPFAASLALQSWVLFLWAIVVILPVTIKKAKMEDELLEHYFQKEFLSYKSNVGGFFPFFKKR